MTTVLSFSGGKDSTAVLLGLIEHGTPPDYVAFFDGEWEFPEMYNHLSLIEKNTGIKITRLKPFIGGKYLSFEDISLGREVSRGKRKGNIGYGWPHIKRRWCTGMKVNALDLFVKGVQADILYIGLAYDEHDRNHDEINDKMPNVKRKYSLMTWKWTEKDALTYCYEKGYDWSGLYKHFPHISCYCCPLKSDVELKTIRKHFPDLWRKMLNHQKKLDNIPNMTRVIKKFKDNRTVIEYDEAFSKQMDLF